MPERNTMKKIQELQQVKGDAYDYYIAGNEDTDLFEKIFLVDDIVEEIFFDWRKRIWKNSIFGVYVEI